jgi:cephalosporin-C deacetylase-like acetyl esterase
MHVTSLRLESETTSDGVSERLFTLGDITGVFWSPVGEPIGPHVARYNAVLAAQAVPEWQATLDALAELDPVGPGGPVGYWGISLGSALGIPLVAAEPRITAAVFGLAGHETLTEAAARVRVPVQFLLQWDDELVPRDAGLALFGAFGSGEKTLHAHCGRHTEVPGFELEDSERFFTRHLLS